MVSDMKKVQLSDELYQVEKLLQMANINCDIEGDRKLYDVPLILENTLSMCLKEAVNNVVRHSKAKHCTITVEQSTKDIVLTVEDDGMGLKTSFAESAGNGLKGMHERIEFVNGKLDIEQRAKGTALTFTVPLVIVYQEG